MDIPLSDIAINKQVYPLLHECIGVERAAINRMGRYTIMVIPFRRVAFDAERDAPGILTDAGYVGVIDHLTGRIAGQDYSTSEKEQFLNIESGIPFPKSEAGIFGNYSAHDNDRISSSIRLPIESLVHAVRKGDLQYVIRNAAEIFHLDAENKMTNALARESMKSKKQQVEMEGKAVEWLIENTLSMNPKSDDEASIGASMLIDKYRHLEAETLGLWSHDTHELSRQVKDKLRQYPVPVSAKSIDRYSKDDDFFRTHKDPVHLVVDPDSSDPNDKKRHFRPVAKATSAIVDKNLSSIDYITEIFAEAYKRSVVDRAMGLGGSVGLDELKGYVDYALERVGYKSETVSIYLSGSSDEIRNKAQLLSRFNEPTAASILLLNADFKKAIEKGDPIREAVSCFPLLNTSKRTVNNFFHNINVAMPLNHFRNQAFHLEKGPVPQPNMIHPGSAERLIKNVALMTTLPEGPFQKEGEERKGDAMWDILSTTPCLIESLEEKVKQVRKGTASMKNALTWVKPYVEDPTNNSMNELHDVGRIIYETYYRPISNYLTYHSGEDIRSELLTPEKSVSDFSLLHSLASSGEYRDVIRASDEAHKRIHETYKRSKPDHSLEWKGCISPYKRGSLEISSVISNHDLGAEGRELNHCVGSYLRSVIRNESYILSLKIDGVRSSTIELAGEDLEELRIVQHRAHSNQMPSEEELALGRQLLADIKSGEVDFNFTPCAGVESRLEQLSATERKEVMDGIAFTRKDVVFGLIDDFHKIAPRLDLWDLLEQHDHAINSQGIKSLKEDYLHSKREKSMERGGEMS